MNSPHIGSTPPDHNLDAFDSEARPAVTETASLVGYALAACAFLALRCDSFACYMDRTRRDAAHSSRRVHEIEGSLVAVTLAAVAVGYGGLVLMTWRGPAPTLSASEATVQQLVAGATAVAPLPVVATAVVARDSDSPDGIDTPFVTASTLNAIWLRNDRRSLQRAFAGLRRDSLALHRCRMEMTATDRAVARCDGGNGGLRPVTWTIDFQRTGGRWAIQRIRNR